MPRNQKSEDTNSVPSRDTRGPFLNAQMLRTQQREEQLSKGLRDFIQVRDDFFKKKMHFIVSN